METLHLNSDTQRSQLDALMERIAKALAAGRNLAVTVAEEDEALSPSDVGVRLGFSRQHVRRLIDAGELAASQMEGSSYWRVPLTSVLAFEERRVNADGAAADWSRALDALGAPPE